MAKKIHTEHGAGWLRLADGWPAEESVGVAMTLTRCLQSDDGFNGGEENNGNANVSRGNIDSPPSVCSFVRVSKCGPIRNDGKREQKHNYMRHAQLFLY